MRQNSLLILLLALLVSACNFDSIYENKADVADAKWDKTKSLVFDVPITDLSKECDILVNVRNNNEYPFSNLYLFIQTISPKAVLQKDTLELTLADNSGKWLGKGWTGIWSSEHNYKSHIKFPVAGTYRFEVKHAMRNDILEGIRDVGIRIVEVKN